MSYYGLMNRVCSIQRAVTARDDRGHVATTWTTLAENVPCALQPVNGKEELAERGLAMNAEFTLLLPPETDIRPNASTDSDQAQGDRVVIDAVAYIVQHVADPSGRGKCKVAFLKRQI